MQITQIAPICSLSPGDTEGGCQPNHYQADRGNPGSDEPWLAKIWEPSWDWLRSGGYDVGTCAWAVHGTDCVWRSPTGSRAAGAR